jgi:soluble lytic murein transglycosylase-like protein
MNYLFKILFVLLGLCTFQAQAVTAERVLKLAKVDLTAAQAHNYAKIINEASRRHRVPPDLIASIIGVESGFDRSAVGGKSQPPNLRVYGLMQLKLKYHQKALRGRSIFDPAANVDVGAAYYAEQIKVCKGDIPCALRKYNQPARSNSTPAIRYAARILRRQRA